MASFYASKRVRLKTAAILFALLMGASADAELRPFVLDSGSFSYLPSPWFFHQHDCPWESGCELDIEGVVTFDVDEKQTSVTLASADLHLIGNDRLVSNPVFEAAPVTAERLTELIGRFEFLRDRTAPAGMVFRDGPIELGLESAAMYLEGTRDHRPADGDGYIFDVTGVETWVGDSNLDGEFNSSDFVTVFRAGLYESSTGQASWMTGDWDGDGKFNSSDFVLAFGDGGYEQGPVAAVPEPATDSVFVLACTLLLGISLNRRRS